MIYQLQQNQMATLLLDYTYNSFIMDTVFLYYFVCLHGRINVTL